MKYRIITLFLSLAFATTVSAESFLSSLEYDAMLGFSLGGTAPVGLPSSIRHLNSYRPTSVWAQAPHTCSPLHGA